MFYYSLLAICLSYCEFKIYEVDLLEKDMYLFIVFKAHEQICTLSHNFIGHIFVYMCPYCTVKDAHIFKALQIRHELYEKVQLSQEVP